ncbi:DUF1150 family protein [bacterium]|nr:DUF1150 family protein [bacterium]
MNVKYENLPGSGPAIVYVRPVQVADLPAELQAQAEGFETLYAVHRPDGARLALVADRGLAFALARQNDLAPVSVH